MITSSKPYCTFRITYDIFQVHATHHPESDVARLMNSNPPPCLHEHTLTSTKHMPTPLDLPFSHQHILESTSFIRSAVAIEYYKILRLPSPRSTH